MLFVVHLLPQPKALAITDLLSVTAVLPSLEYHLNIITQYVACCDCLFNIMLLRFICDVACISSSFLLRNSIIECWPRGSFGWRVVPCTERLQVRFPVRAHAQVVSLIPSWATYGRQPIDVLVFLSLSPPLHSFLSLSLFLLSCLSEISGNMSSCEDSKNKFKKKTALLRCNSDTIQFTHLKYTRFLVIPRITQQLLQSVLGTGLKKEVCLF